VLGMARRITGGACLKQLDGDLTGRRFDRQTAKRCGVRLDSPAAVLLDDSPA